MIDFAHTETVAPRGVNVQLSRDAGPLHCDVHYNAAAPFSRDWSLGMANHATIEDNES